MTGKSGMWIEKIRIRMIPSQNEGIAKAIRNQTRATWSNTPPLRSAEITPTGIEITAAMAAAYATRKSVAGSRSKITVAAGSR